MLVKEKFSDENLFALMGSIHTLPWVSSDFINTYWLTKCGDMNLLPTVEDKTVAEIATMISPIVADKWDTQYHYYHLNLLVDGNKTETWEKTVKEDSTNKTSSTGESGHKVSAFDSTTMVDENSDTTSNSTDNNGTTNRTENKTSTAKTGNYINDFISYNKYLTNIGFYDMIISDVNKCIVYVVHELDF